MKRFQDHHRRPLQKNSGQNISWPGPKRNSAKISTAPQRERSATHKVTRRLREPCQNSQRATTRAIRHTHTMYGDGCTSRVKIRSALQRERSDPHKVPRGLRESDIKLPPRHKTSDPTHTCEVMKDGLFS